LCCCASFHSGDPEQVVPLVLYTVFLYILTHILAVISAGRSLSFALVSDNFCFLLQCTLDRLQALLTFTLILYQVFNPVSLTLFVHVVFDHRKFSFLPTILVPLSV
jgi:hypothetical protein